MESIDFEEIQKCNKSLESAIHRTKESINLLSVFIKMHVLDLRLGITNEEQSEIYNKIRKHRFKYYLEKAMHLTSEKELISEQLVDAKSIIFAIEINGQILLSIRVTPRPFEMENFGIHDINFEQYNNYAELGRLVSDPDMDQISMGLLARYLLCYTGLKSVEKYRFAGFVAICRPFRLTYFKKFGLQETFSFFYNERKLTYHFLTAKMEDILEHTSSLQVNEDYLIKRLQRTYNV
jgi:hypothetical protein